MDEFTAVRGGSTLVLFVLVGITATAAGLTALTWRVAVGAPRGTSHGLVHGTARAIETQLRAHQRLGAFLRRRTSPGELTGLVLTLALGALVLVAALAYQVRRDSAVVRLDHDVSQWAAEHATSTSTDVLRVITDTGGTPIIVLITVVVALIELWRTRARGVALFLLVVVGGQFAANNLVKVVIGRDRPVFEQLVSTSGASFPSGHSAAAAACFAACALCLGRRRSRRVHVVLASLAASIAFMVATSRVLLGVHWLSDTVAGLCFGAGWFALCAIAFGGRLLRFGAPVEAAERVERLTTLASATTGADTTAQDVAE